MALVAGGARTGSPGGTAPLPRRRRAGSNSMEETEQSEMGRWRAGERKRGEGTTEARAGSKTPLRTVIRASDSVIVAPVNVIAAAVVVAVDAVGKIGIAGVDLVSNFEEGMVRSGRAKTCPRARNVLEEKPDVWWSTSRIRVAKSDQTGRYLTPWEVRSGW